MNLKPNDPIAVAAAYAVEDPEAMATYPLEVLQTLTLKLINQKPNHQCFPNFFLAAPQAVV